MNQLIDGQQIIMDTNGQMLGWEVVTAYMKYKDDVASGS